jgi:hypothetical protein
MNIAQHWPWVCVPAAVVYVVLATMQHHRTEGDTEIYKIPYAFTFFWFAAFLFFESIPFWQSIPSDAVSFVVFRIFFPLPFFVIWLRNLRYRVEVTGSKVVAGSFSRHQFYMREVVDFTLTQGRMGLLTLRLRSGRKRYISGLIVDFEALAAKLVSQVGRAE